MAPGPSPVRILCIAGSTRSASLNRRLLGHCTDRLTAMGAVPETFDLRERPLPLYDGDLEASDGIPSNAIALAEAIRGCDGLLIACPEYNAGMTAVLKNALDWASRVRFDEGSTFPGKTAALVAASPGRLGGLRGLVHTRLVLTELGCTVLSGQVAVPSAAEGLSESGSPTVEPVAAMLESLLEDLVRTAGLLRA
ncbi:MAG: NADPH-dependent FMN reductase [Fimbriimonadaceae bacterium]